MKFLYSLIAIFSIVVGFGIYYNIHRNKVINSEICNMFEISDKHDETAVKIIPFDSDSTYTFVTDKYQYDEYRLEQNFLIECDRFVKHIKINSNYIETYYSNTIEPQIRATGEDLYSVIKQSDDCMCGNYRRNFVVILPESSATIALEQSSNSSNDTTATNIKSRPRNTGNNMRALKMHIATHNLKNPALGIL